MYLILSFIHSIAGAKKVASSLSLSAQEYFFIYLIHSLALLLMVKLVMKISSLAMFIFFIDSFSLQFISPGLRPASCTKYTPGKRLLSRIGTLFAFFRIVGQYKFSLSGHNYEHNWFSLSN